MYTKWGANNTMDYDWLGVQSEQHLTTVLIETRLTKDILLDEIGEMGKKRWELAYPTTQKMIFYNGCMNSSKAFGYSYFRCFLFSVFPFIPVSVNAFSAEIGQRRAYKTLSLYYNVQTFSFIRSGSSNHLTLSINDTDSEYTNWRLNKLLYSPAACSMPRIVMPYYHVLNKWLTKHLLERCAGHETVWDTRPPYKCLEALNTFPAHVYFKSNRPWKSSRRGIPGD